MDSLKETVEAQTKLQWMRDRGYTEEEIRAYIERKDNRVPAKSASQN